MKDDPQPTRNLLERADRFEAISDDLQNQVNRLRDRIRELERVIGCERAEGPE